MQLFATVYFEEGGTTSCLNFNNQDVYDILTKGLIPFMTDWNVPADGLCWASIMNEEGKELLVIQVRPTPTSRVGYAYGV